MNKSGEWVQTPYTKVQHFLPDENFCSAICKRQIKIQYMGPKKNTKSKIKPSCKNCIMRLAR